MKVGKELSTPVDDKASFFLFFFTDVPPITHASARANKYNS